MAQQVTQPLESASAAKIPWLAEAMLKFRSDGDRAAIDVIFRSVDRLMREGRSDEVNLALTTVDAASLPVDVLLAILTITFVPRREFSARPAFFDAAHRALRARGEDADLLLRGLN